MVTVPGIQAVRIHIIKKYGFLEPVFFPEKLRKNDLFTHLFNWHLPPDPRALSKHKQVMTSLIERGKQISLDDTMVVKRVRDPYLRGEAFWRLFVKDAVSPFSMSSVKPLPMFPFQVVFSQPKASIEKAVIERYLNQPLTNVDVRFDALLYLPGMASAHFSLSIEVPSGTLDLLSLGTLSRAWNNLPISFSKDDGGKGKEKGVFSFLDHRMEHLFKALLEEYGENKSIDGYYTCYNFQGRVVDWMPYVEDLAQLMMCHQREDKNLLKQTKDTIHSSIGATRYKNDLLAIGDQIAFSSIDNGLWEKARQSNKTSILEGRRCFRTHFESLVELAYITGGLVQEYTALFKELLRELQATSLAISPLDITQKALTTGALSPVAYTTLQTSILGLTDSLHKGRDIWGKWYLDGAKLLGVDQEVKDLIKAADDLYHASVAFQDARFQTFQAVLADLLKTFEAFSAIMK